MIFNVIIGIGYELFRCIDEIILLCLCVRLRLSVHPGWSVEDDTTVPVHRLAGAGHSKVRRRFHRLHRSGAQDKGTVWPGRPDHSPLQVWGLLRGDTTRELYFTPTKNTFKYFTGLVVTLSKERNTKCKALCTVHWTGIPIVCDRT